MTPLPRNPTGIAVLSVSSVGIFIDFIAIGLRFWSRKLKRKGLDIGDYLIVIAWLLAFADLIRKIFAFKWGVGLHMWEIISTDPSHLLDAAAITFAGYFVWLACVTCIKLSILFVYRDLFYCITWFTRFVHAMMVLCVLFFIGFMIGICLQCTPFEYNYNPSVPGGHCGISRSGGFYVIGSLNLFMDVVLVVMPLPVVWTLKISFLKKLGVSAMFGLGLVIIALVGYRFNMIQHQNPEDFIHDGEPPGIVNSLELYLGMISACLPFLSPPIAKMSTSFSGLRIYSYLSSVTGRNSKEKISNEAPSESDYLEMMDSYRKEPNKDAYDIPRTVDEEITIDGGNFVTVPEQWPSGFPLEKPAHHC